MNIYLIRHGETDWNREHKLQGQTNNPLNSNGIEMARKTAEGLSRVDFDCAFSSPLERAVKTAEIILGDRDLAIEIDDRLIEINFGEAEGMNLDKVKDSPESPIYNFEYDTVNFIPAKGGETFDEIYQRTNEFFMEKIMPLEGSCRNILIVGHGCMNRTIVNEIAGVPLKDFWHAHMGNCNISIIKVEKGEAKVIEESMSFCK